MYTRPSSSPPIALSTTPFLFFLTILFLNIASVSCACTCTPNGSTCNCCVTPFGTDHGAKQACVTITMTGGLYQFVQNYGSAQLNQLTFENALQPEIEHANCVSNQDIGWCLLILNFSTTKDVGTGNMTSTFVGRYKAQGTRVNKMYYGSDREEEDPETMITMWQGSFKVGNVGPPPPPPYPKVHTQRYAIDGPIEECNSMCPVTGGCRCVNDGCACCSTPLSFDKACVQLTGFGEVKVLQANVMVSGETWMATITNGDNPRSSCATNTQYIGKVVCVTFDNLSFSSKNIQGSVFVTVAVDGRVSEVIPVGEFIL